MAPTPLPLHSVPEAEDQSDGSAAVATLLVLHLRKAIPHDVIPQLLSHYGASSVRPCAGVRFKDPHDFHPQLVPEFHSVPTNGISYNSSSRELHMDINVNTRPAYGTAKGCQQVVGFSSLHNHCFENSGDGFASNEQNEHSRSILHGIANSTLTTPRNPDGPPPPSGPPPPTTTTNPNLNDVSSKRCI
ncbi:U11/U12 small nuclear ribonucleoprotein 65 kDa protein [Canna indica]|uniref:U11/U12 small nuclear ribonucleoprotein 65 kDa protein n=1 Tax=Canna indica TaxID=4628 RepID=A0AAQ3KLB9_9LILI|nr:U11/U12 small nuclear ribonucleoprotein 65 kDa protein [Canna indica]